jgi:hypothetical protein
MCPVRGVGLTAHPGDQLLDAPRRGRRSARALIVALDRDPQVASIGALPPREEPLTARSSSASTIVGTWFSHRPGGSPSWAFAVTRAAMRFARSSGSVGSGRRRLKVEIVRPRHRWGRCFRGQAAHAATRGRSEARWHGDRACGRDKPNVGLPTGCPPTPGASRLCLRPRRPRWRSAAL